MTSSTLRKLKVGLTAASLVGLLGSCESINKLPPLQAVSEPPPTQRLLIALVAGVTTGFIAVYLWLNRHPARNHSATA